jgi:hypothetical protein
MQDAAIQTLVQQSLLDADAFGQGQAVRTSDPLSADLNERILASNEADLPLMSFLFSELDQVSFDGAMGLKARTGLGEYRYDIV